MIKEKEINLFESWKNKPKETIIINNNEYIISHKNSSFVKDGIVNHSEWIKNENLKIMFFLKEAYYEQDSSLVEDINKKAPWGMWQKISQWIFGLEKTTENHIEPLIKKIYFAENNSFLQKIAIVNIKKSNGNSTSNMEEITAYAKADKDYIKKQIEIINPKIIICGNTYNFLKNILHEENLPHINENRFTIVDLFGEEVIIINYYHPANRYPDILNYYGLLAIYQQALKAKTIK